MILEDVDEYFYDKNKMISPANKDFTEMIMSVIAKASVVLDSVRHHSWAKHQFLSENKFMTGKLFDQISVKTAS